MDGMANNQDSLKKGMIWDIHKMGPEPIVKLSEITPIDSR